MSVVVLGSANVDLVYRVDRLPGGGETVLATDVARHPGGKGLNQVVAAARAGAPSSFLGALGEDSEGDLLASTLSDDGIEATLVRRVPEQTGTALITVDANAENTIVVAAGANARLTRLTENERAAIASADTLLAQLEIPLETVVDAATHARQNGTRVVLNAAPIRPLNDDVLALVDLLVVNEHEALQLIASRVRGVEHGVTVDNARDLLAPLLERVPAVVVTLGAAGAVVLTRDLEDAPAAHLAGIRVEAVDTTGAGDTFCGALVAALDRGEEFISAAAFATAAASIAVQHPGAVSSIPHRREIEAVLSADHSAPGAP